MGVRCAGRQTAAAIVVVGLGVFLGCAASNPYSVGSFQRAEFYSDHDRPQEAADAFGLFVRHNPADSLAAEAQYRKGIEYMKVKEYPLAAVELQILQKDYPTSPRVEDAMYQEGVAYLDEIGRVERDVSGAYDARAQLQKFLRNYPDSQYASDAKAKLAEISDLLVRKRLRAVNVYRQLGHWQAVAITLDYILDEEPGSTLIDQVLLRRAEVAHHLDDDATARTMYQRLLDEYPDSMLASRARSELAALDGRTPPPGDIDNS